MTSPTAKKPAASLGSKLIRGVLWSGLNTFVLRIGQLAMSIVLARVVSPSQFGVFVVASTIYLIIINVSEVGLTSALLREVDNADKIAPTITTLAALNSAILAGAMFLAAPMLASALGAPAATNAVRVLAIPLFLAGPTAVPAALMARDFQQGRKLISDLTNFMVSNGVLIVLALRGDGAMALAWSRVAGQVASAILLYAMTSHRYWPGFDLREAKRLLSFGLPLAGANLLGFTLANVDFMTVGRLAGSLQLGYYDLAYSVSSWPVSIFSTILSSVTLPVLARVEGGVKAVERHVAAALAAVCTVSFPVSMVCMVLARPLIEVVYGAKWEAAAPALVALSVFGAARVIIALFSDLLVAVNKTRTLFKLQLIWLIVLVPVMVVMVHYNKGTGAGEAHVIVALTVVLPLYFLALKKTTNFSLRVMFNSIIRPLVSVVVAGGVSWQAIAVSSVPLLQLLIGFTVFFVAYIVLLGRWPLGLVREMSMLYGKRSGMAKRRMNRLAIRDRGRHRKGSIASQLAWSGSYAYSPRASRSVS